MRWRGEVEEGRNGRDKGVLWERVCVEGNGGCGRGRLSGGGGGGGEEEEEGVGGGGKGELVYCSHFRD